MSIFKSAQLVLYFLAVLVIRCAFSTLEVKCETLDCPSFKTNATRCTLAYVDDPLTNECIARCSTPCELGKCRSCYCLLPAANMSSKQLDGCFNLYNRYRCSGGLCYRRENYCPENYVISPYDEGECVRRCNTDSCGKGHCSPLGMCVCLFGYRPDPLNPRTCTKIPMNPPDPQPSGYRESTGYTASIVADNNKEKMPAENTSFNLYTMISAFIAAILLITTSVLIFVIIKLKRSPRNRANPQEQNEEANSENHYSIIKFENESNDGIPVKHIVLSRKTNKILPIGTKNYK